MLKDSVLVIVLSSCIATAIAETVYVTDSLRLGLHQADDTSDRPFDNLISGTALEVLERTTNYARVRTPGGQEGWVKAAYLVELKPAQARLAELESELARVRLEADQSQSARIAAETELNRLGQRVAASTGSAEAAQDTLARLQSENEAFEARFETYRRSLPLTWVVAALVVTLVGGFLAGLWWLDALIRRRHGGFRIY